MLLKKFIDFCQTEKIFPPRKIVVAVSGGADSLALADLLHRSQRLFGLELCIAHFEHGLRGQDSLDDAAYVKSFAENLGVEFFMENGDVQSFAAAQKISVETAARQLRYEFLARVRLQKNFDAIALAHHADDQAETILMRLIRGSGVTGLSAMKFRADSPHGLLIRPLLRFKKWELENYCRARNLLPRIDATNFDAVATRNKIRLELLPALEKFNPAITETLCRFAEISAADSDFIDAETEKIYPRVVRNGEILREDFLKLHPAIQREVIKKFIAEQTGGVTDFGFTNFDAVRKVLANGLAGVELPKNFRANLKRGKLSITKNFNSNRKGMVTLKTKEDFIESVLYTEEQIAERVRELSAQITNDYKNITKPLLTVGILNGAVVFYTDLVRNLRIPVHFDFMIASSYDANTQSSGKVNILKNLDNDPRGRDILLIEDIIDSGTTMNYLVNYFKEKGAASVKVAALLDKPSRRKIDVTVDYIGFEVPDEFIVGYGLDFAQHYRNLPYLGILKRSVYSK